MKFRFPSKQAIERNLRGGSKVDASFVASLAGMTRQHVTRLCRKGILPGAYQTKGGHWRLRWSEGLANWIAQNQKPEGLSRVKGDETKADLEQRLCAVWEMKQLLERKAAMLQKLQRHFERAPDLGPQGRAIPELLANPFRGLVRLPESKHAAPYAKKSPAKSNAPAMGVSAFTGTAPNQAKIVAEICERLDEMEKIKHASSITFIQQLARLRSAEAHPRRLSD